MQGRRWVERRDARTILMGSAFLFLMAVTSSRAVRPSLAQEAEVIMQGRVYYQQYCAACHGPAAKGDGPLAAELKVTPADPTQICKKNGGEFPMWRVYRVIDGQEEVKGHGTL